jgi:hypothetical protein
MTVQEARALLVLLGEVPAPNTSAVGNTSRVLYDKLIEALSANP